MTQATEAVAAAAAAPSSLSPRSASRRLVRSSGLLLSGRFLSMAINFAAQVLIVRHLSQTAYGAFAYAISMISVAQSVVALGFERALVRYLPIDHERRDYGRLFGTMGLALGTVLGLGLLLVAAVQIFHGSLAASGFGDPQARSLMFILVFLVPVQAIDEMLVSLFAVFAHPRSIFLRKHVLAPALRLVVAGALVATGGDVFFLARSYLIAAVAGVVIYIFLLARELSRLGLWQHFDRRTLRLPWAEIFAFTLPLLSTDLVYTVMHAMDVVILEHFHGSADVAALRAVQPAARLNEFVLFSFTLLFSPAAARLFARQDGEGIRDLYWQTAAWIAVLTFPVFVATTVLARPLTVLLFGERYEQSALLLALLACGYYFTSATGLNGLTLRVYGKVRYLVGINVATAAISLMVNLLLIPRFGAAGAAAGTLVALIVHNVLKQTGLGLWTAVGAFDRRYAGVYATIAAAAVAILAIQQLLDPPFPVSVVVAAVASLGVLRASGRMLRVEHTFPELLRLPGARLILSR
jgi:O-antigen/teichoic acid export membrane protein